MGKDYAETGITINALAPAVIRTADGGGDAGAAGETHDRQGYR